MMSQSIENLDAQGKEIKALSKDIDPTENNIPDSLAEATTVPLDDDALGGNATEEDVKKNKDK